MIASLRGKPVARTSEGLVLDVGGVGYLVHATPRALARSDGVPEVTLPTYLAVREDALQLYGFADADEREPGSPDLVARDALVELGYTPVDAERALATTDPGLPPEERVRQALRQAA